MAEINYQTEKSWGIKDDKPIHAVVEERPYGYTCKYYIVHIPRMTISYDKFWALEKFDKVKVSSYDYANGKAQYSSWSLDHIREWAEENNITLEYKV